MLTALIVATVLGLVAFVCAAGYAWHRLGGAAKALRMVLGADTAHGERVALAVGLALILFGWAGLPGPLDEIAGALLVAWVARRVEARRAAPS